MKTAALHDVRSDPASYLDASEPVLFTQGGKVSGVYIPLAEESEDMTSELERTIARVLGHRLSRLLDSQGVSEEDVQRDFDAFRRARR